MGPGRVAPVVAVDGPVVEVEDALEEGVCEGEVCAEHGGVGFAEVPFCPFCAEGVGEGVVFVEGCGDDLYSILSACAL